MKKNIDWIFELKDRVPVFLNRMKGEKEGYYRYSLSGDLFSENERWGLGNTVFAAKIFYTIDMVDLMPMDEKKNIINFIKSFQRTDGSIYDPLITKKVSLLKKIFALKNFDIQYLRGEKTKRAETRQSFSALQLLGSRPDLPYLQIPYTVRGIDKYLSSLDWSRPYDAGSHFSHLLFFLYTNKRMFNIYSESTDHLIDYSIKWINKLQSSKDGSWHQGQNIAIPQKINGAMKIITGLKAVNKLNFKHPEKLIDLCLRTTNFKHACNILDVIYVLKYANELVENNHRYKDIRDFCYKWLRICREHYFPDIGGFSFFKHKANHQYYGTIITKGINEPDIHGTVLLLWGIALTSNILGIDKEVGFKEFIT